MKERLEEFLGLSVCVTGFGRLRLLGTGMAEQYMRELDGIVSPRVVDSLLAAYSGLPAGEGRQAVLQERVFDDPVLGPVARNLIVLWYCGVWKKLPEAWRAAHGSSPLDEEHVVSSAAYLSGLQWTVIDAHPAGGLQQGFAAWSAPPEGSER